MGLRLSTIPDFLLREFPGTPVLPGRGQRSSRFRHNRGTGLFHFHGFAAHRTFMATEFQIHLAFNGVFVSS